jgi:hypothetical protein
MSHFDLSAGHYSQVGFTPASAPDVKVISPNSQAYPPPPMQPSSATERSERATARIVIALTLACTILALYDLFLLTTGT